MRRLCMVLLVANAACLRVAEERALRDQLVGRAESADMTVQVRDGLGRILAIGGERLTLWAGAPELEITVEVRETSSLTLEVHNLLRDAELIGPGPVMLLESSIPTRKVWHIEVEPGATTLAIRGPDRLRRDPWRFLALADVQDAIDDVQDIYTVMNRDEEARFVAFSGDLTETGSDRQLLRFKREAKNLRIPIYATLGNHELGSGAVTFHDHFGRGNSSFVFRGVRFTLLDSASATLDPIVHDWLDGWLEQGKDQVHIIAMHIPLLDPVGARNGAFASRAEAAGLLRRFADHGVDLTIYGHVHSYYAFENAGIPAFITGGGGAIPERFDGVGRHYLAVDVRPVSGAIETSIVRID